MPKTIISKWKDQGIFFTLQALAVLGTIALGKVIAMYFDPTEYGKYFIASSAVGLYLIVSAGPIIQAYRHFHYREKKKELLVFYRSVLFWLSIIVFLVLTIISLLGFLPFMAAMLAAGQVLFHKNAAIHQANINIQGRTTIQAILQVLVPIFNLALVLLILFSARHADYLVLWAALVCTELSIMVISYTVFTQNRVITILRPKFLLASEHLKGLIRFVKPLLLLPVFAWLVNNADRYLLGIFHSQHEVGLYSAAYSVGGKLFILLSGGIVAFYNAPVYRQAMDKSQYKELYADGLKRILAYVVFGGGLVVLIYFLSDFIGMLLLSDQYAPAFALIPALALANLILSAAMLLEQGLYAIGKTRYILLHYIIGAIGNVVLNLFLIPLYGMWGAAISMILSTIIQISVLFLFYRNALVIRTVNS